MSDGRLYIFAGPIVSLLIAIVFLLVWLHDRERRCGLYFASAFCAYALAALIQITGFPREAGPNAVVSAIVYTFAVLTLVEGVLVRFGRAGSGRLLLVMACAIVALVFYFFYFDRDLVARIYVQNLGYGTMFVVAAVKMVALERRRPIDRLLFWAFLLFGLHFFIRTGLTMRISGDLFEIDRMRENGADPADLAALFRATPFWQVLNFSLLISGLLLALALLGSIAADAIDEIRREGRSDALTGLGTRRDFMERARDILADPGARPVTLIAFDMDRFKQINEDFGPTSGDRMLSVVGRLILQETSPRDAAARMDGEEFVVLLARTNRVGASRVADRLRAELDFARLSVLPPHATVTASFGVAEQRPGESLDSLLSRAEGLVAVAKAEGRDGLATDAPAPEQKLEPEYREPPEADAQDGAQEDAQEDAQDDAQEDAQDGPPDAPEARSLPRPGGRRML
ncbi:GGDEF domain-containing protein [Xanthobacter sp. 91]|uniref:GGDEF domain-containing protein n=1 Tax=Xanthobacter sp. 91 TaxID=1117244 RepID=UPI000691C364|nr:GGDEF domain-containing protein [Xanthobacter sp. 91]